MNTDVEHVPIEEPIEIVVGPEITLETNLPPTSQPTDVESCDNNSLVLQSNSPSEAEEPIQKIDKAVNCIKEERETSKRHRDMMKKRARRQDLEYRKTESMKAKERMANRRNDPAYRELERQRDRERRAKARQDKAFREKERERDRHYKKKQRISNTQPEVQSILGVQEVNTEEHCGITDLKIHEHRCLNQDPKSEIYTCIVYENGTDLHVEEQNYANLANDDKSEQSSKVILYCDSVGNVQNISNFENTVNTESTANSSIRLGYSNIKNSVVSNKCDVDKEHEVPLTCDNHSEQKAIHMCDKTLNEISELLADHDNLVNKQENITFVTIQSNE